MQNQVFCIKFTSIEEDSAIKDLQINGDIREKEVRLIDSSGEQRGVMSYFDAQRLADAEELDLVKISPNANPPVCKIMDYSKFKYEQSKKEKEIKKNQKVIEMKEVRLSMTIDVGDLNTKAKIARKFLEAGNKVKATIRMRGRQQAYAKQGVEVMNHFFEGLSDICTIDKKPSTEGRIIYMILAPITETK